jgi:hypothetical protein
MAPAAPKIATFSMSTSVARGLEARNRTLTVAALIGAARVSKRYAYT